MVVKPGVLVERIKRKKDVEKVVVHYEACLSRQQVRALFWFVGPRKAYLSRILLSQLTGEAKNDI